MSKRKFSDAFVVAVALVLIAVAVLVLSAMRVWEFSVTTSPPSLSEPSVSHPSSQEAQTLGSGSYCCAFSLTYFCRQLAIKAPPVKIAGLINNRGTGISTLDLARGS